MSAQFTRDHQRQIGERKPIPFTVDTSGCHLFTGYLNKKGYGLFRRAGAGQKLAHRVAFEYALGAPIPAGLGVLHRCDVPACVNVGHLFLGTAADNNADRKAKNRSARMFGAGNGRAVLTDAQVAAIRADKRFQRVIAHEYGVAQTTISWLKRGVTWSKTAETEAV